MSRANSVAKHELGQLDLVVSVPVFRFAVAEWKNPADELDDVRRSCSQLEACKDELSCVLVDECGDSQN